MPCRYVPSDQNRSIPEFTKIRQAPPGAVHVKKEETDKDEVIKTRPGGILRVEGYKVILPKYLSSEEFGLKKMAADLNYKFEH